MHLLAVLGALAILTIAGALCFVLLRALRLRSRHRRLLRQGVPALEELGAGESPLFRSEAALYNGSRFADGTPLLFPALRAPCVGELWCSDRALFLRREEGAPGEPRLLVWPFTWIAEASLHRAFAPLAGKELPILRLRWSRGGERLLTELSLRGGMAQLERLRKEIHLRQDAGSMLVQLGKLGAGRPVP